MVESEKKYNDHRAFVREYSFPFDLQDLVAAYKDVDYQKHKYNAILGEGQFEIKEKDYGYKLRYEKTLNFFHEVDETIVYDWIFGSFNLEQGFIIEAKDFNLFGKGQVDFAKVNETCTRKVQGELIFADNSASDYDNDIKKSFLIDQASMKIIADLTTQCYLEHIFTIKYINHGLKTAQATIESLQKSLASGHMAEEVGLVHH